MDLPAVDVTIVESVLRKKANKEKLTSDEKRAFLETMGVLRDQADQVASKIAEMLPQSQRGYYKEK